MLFPANLRRKVGIYILYLKKIEKNMSVIRFCRLLAVAATLLLHFSCAEKGDKGPGYRVVFEMEIPSEIHSRWDGDDFTLPFTSNVTWGVQYDEGCDWFALMPDYWEDYGKEPVTKKAELVTEMNDFNVTRTGRCFVIPEYGHKLEIKVVQDPNPEGTPPPSAE